MATVGFSDRKTVINVLTEGKELASELKRKLHPTITSREACDSLVESIVSSYENAITLLDLLGNADPSQTSITNLVESPLSIEASPTSEGSAMKFKKRKALAGWSEPARVCPEGQVDDGYSWRKYGQKEILGAKHPRAYYRCTHRNTQGCLATKQVQRADNDPWIVEVIYRGKHSCKQERLKEKKQTKENETLAHSRKLKKIKTGEIEHFPSFSFPSTPIETENVGSTFFVGTSYSSPFHSLETSEPYSLLNDFGIGLSWESLESDFDEIMSDPTPFTDVPFGDLDIPIPIPNEVNFSWDLLEALDGF